MNSRLDTQIKARLREPGSTRYNESRPRNPAPTSDHRMDELSAQLRPYKPADLPKLAGLLEAARAWPPVAPVSPEDVIARWQRRHVDPERDVTVLPGPSGDLVAFYSVTRF